MHKNIYLQLLHTQSHIQWISLVSMSIERRGSILYHPCAASRPCEEQKDQCSTWSLQLLYSFCFTAMPLLPHCSFLIPSPSKLTSPQERTDTKWKGWEVARSSRLSRLVPSFLTLFCCSSLLLLFLFPSASSLYPRFSSFTPRLLTTSFVSFSHPHTLCRFPALTNSSSFFSLRQPDYISYMSLPERALYTFSLPCSPSLSTQFTSPLLLSISSLWRCSAPTETSSCCLARCIFVCVMSWQSSAIAIIF